MNPLTLGRLHYLDILICCHLAHIFYAKAPNCRLADHALLTHPELFAYVDRVVVAGDLERIQSSRRAAPSEWGKIPLLWSSARTSLVSSEKAEARAPTPEEKQLVKTRAYSFIAATFSMAFYIVYHGLLTSGEETSEELKELSDMTELENE